MKHAAHVALNAHLLSGQDSYRSAGIHAYIYNTLIGLTEIDSDLRFTAFIGGGSVETKPNLEVRRSRLPTGNPLVRILWEQAAAPMILAHLKADLWHGMAFSIPLLARIPSVVTIYDLSFLRFPERLSRSRQWYLSVLARQSVRRVRRVIAISESGKKEIMSMLAVPESRIDVAIPGVSRYFRPAAPEDIRDFRENMGLPERFILYVGTLEPRKNLTTLIHAYARLPEKARVKLVLVGGKGWQSDALPTAIASLGLEADVIIPGYVPYQELPLWYSSAEVFAYPSVYEGFGLPLVEAMACGLPVVASDTTSLPEAVGAAGTLVRPMDVSAWADALSSLLSNKTLRDDFSERGIRHAARFSWENTAQQTIASYYRALV